MRGAGGRGCSHGGAIVLLFLVGLAVRSDGRQLRLAELSHTPRNIGANEWWDAVTGADEYGDVVTTFMHKVGTACTPCLSCIERLVLSIRLVLTID